MCSSLPLEIKMQHASRPHGFEMASLPPIACRKEMLEVVAHRKTSHLQASSFIIHEVTPHPPSKPSSRVRPIRSERYGDPLVMIPIKN